MVNIFHINIEDMLEMHDVIFEVYIEDRLTNKQQMKAPKEMLITNFLQTAKQIQADRRPIKLKMIRPDTIWDSIEQRQKTLYNEIELSNNAMVAWKESKKENKV